MADVNAQNLTMEFGDFTAVKDVSFGIETGKFVTLLGPSGCGKTTLLKMISGFLTPTKGKISIGGKDVTEVPPENRDTALCFQSYALFPHLTVLGNLEFGLRQQRIPRDERDRRVASVSEQLELAPQMAKLPNQLSGGQQQRVALGRALVMQPSVILFDEPLSNLDAKLRDQVRIEIKRIQQENDLTALYVTHDQSEALALSDTVLVMNGGRVEQAAAPEDLYHNPATSFVADFIGNANILDADVVGDENGDGHLLSTPIGHLTSTGGQKPVSKKIRTAWRPENAVLSDEGDIHGQVVTRSFQGHFTDLQVKTNDTIYRIQTSRSDVHEGEKIRFDIAPEHVLKLESQ